MTSTTSTHMAPVLLGARQGGAVIVWMTNQHSNLNLRTHWAARSADDHSDQSPVVADIKAHGGTDIVQLVSVNAVAAHVSKAEVQRLRHFAGVAKIVPDSTVTVGDPETTGPATTNATTIDRVAAREAAGHRASAGAAADDNPFPTVNNCGTQDDPLIEPEALSVINAPAMTNAGLATEPGHGVIVANDGLSEAPDYDLVGNPNFVRPAADGGGSVVLDAQPGDTTDETDGEYYGDASSIAAQGTVEYQYSNELPYSGMPASCYFKLVGDAPGASLVDTDDIDTPESRSADTSTDSDTMSESQIVAGIDAAVEEHADVINESYGYSLSPGSYATHYAANDAAIAAGVTVVVSSGDSGDSGTVSSPASDPQAIAVGATNSLRLNAMAYGFTGWVNNDITPLSSGGTTPNNKVVDLVAPGYGGEAACNPDGSDCPTNTETEAFGGTSEASPLVAGAAADVIQAYRDTHNGDSPSPAVVKEILTSTATDVDAPADEQGAGLLNIQAAVSAAQRMPNTTDSTSYAGLVASPTQLDVTAAAGSTSLQNVTLYNTASTSTSVTGTYRELGPEQQIGSTVTENVSAPDPNAAVPVDGAQAAQDITFTVPAGLDRLDADMIWPDPTNSTILNFILTDPSGRLRQISYDYGTANTKGGIGTVPDIQHVEVANPEAGQWTAQIKWGNGRSHLQDPPNVPGSYTGTVSFKVSGQNWITSPATSGAVTVGAGKTATVPLAITMPSAPGDHPESVDFVATNGAATSVPIARRSLIPTSGGPFNTLITSTVGRGNGQISTFNVQVLPGTPNLGVTVQTPDTSADDPMTLFFVNPSGTSVLTHVVTGPPQRTVNGLPFTTQTINGATVSAATGNVANPAAGTWEIDVELNLTTSGQEFTQTVAGDVLPQAPVITSPADGSSADTQTPTVSGTGGAGDTVTVADADGNSLCTAVVGDDGNWSCTTSTLAAGTVSLTATQADETGDPSPASNAVSVSIPAATSVALSLDPAAPALGQAVTLTATTTGVPDGTVVTFADNGSSIGTGDVTSDVATLSLPSGLAVGDHALTATAAATDTTLASQSAPVDVTIAKSASTIALTLSSNPASYGHGVTGSIAVGGATSGTATVTYGAKTTTVTIGANGKGTFKLPATLSVGGHPITAVYNGTGTVAASDPTTATLQVVKAGTTTHVKLKSTHVRKGRRAHVTITVGGHAAGAYPTGTLRVTATLGTTTKVTKWHLGGSQQGVRSVTAKLPHKAGHATIVVRYSGNGDFTASTSTSKTVVIKKS